MRISVNLANRPYADLGPAIKRLRIAMAVLVLVGIGLALGLHAFHRKAEDARAREHSLDAKIAQITQERKAYEDLMHEPANAQLLVQAAALNRLFEEKTFSWTLAMEDLEIVLPGGVQVNTLEPARDKNGRITLHLRVVGPRDRTIDLVKNLEHSRHFVLPRIAGESAETGAGPNEKQEPVSASNRVTFELLADYNPADSSDHRPVKKVESEPAPAAAEHPGMPPAPPRAAHATVLPAAPGQRPGPGRQTYTGQSQPPSKPHPGGPR
jgi:type IV pilus assembly protein PilN